MAKLNLKVQLLKDSGASIGSEIQSGAQLTETAAKAVIQAEINVRKTAAAGASQDLIDADNAFNS